MTELRRVRDVLLRRIALGVGVAAIVGTHAPVVGYKTFANVDESYALALAERLLEGQKLYVGAISQRGPLMYYSYEAIAWLFGWDNVVALRLVALAFALLHLALVYVLAKRTLSSRAAIFATLLSGYGLSVGLPPFDRFALNGEFLQVPPLLVGTWLGILATSRVALTMRARSIRERMLLVLASGFRFGIAIAVKQSIALHVLPIALAIVARDVRTWRRAFAFLSIFAGGIAIVPLAFIAHAAADGTLGAMIYYTVTYNIDVHVGEAASFFSSISSLGRELDSNPSFGVALIVAAGAVAPRVWSATVRAFRSRSAHAVARAFSPTTIYGMQLVVAVISGATLRRFFPHYFIPALPFLALTLGAFVARACRGRRIASVTQAALVGAITLFLVAGMEAYQLEKIDGHVTHDRALDRFSKWVTASTNPDDRIFVWGFSPWIYAYSHRRPAGRYVFETYVTGFIPWFHDDLDVEKQRVVKGSLEALLGDLDREKPTLVVDAGAVMIARSMRAYPLAAEWLHANYCFEVRVTGFDVYRRKSDPSVVCRSPFPFPQHVFDYGGRPIDVPMPRTVDEESSAFLHAIDPSVPAWFPSEEKPAHAEMLLDPLDTRHAMRFDGMTLPPSAAEMR